MCKEAIYGLPEINKNDISEARLIACPGCYPTSALIPLMRIGDQLGLFQKIADLGPITSKKFAEEAKVDERYLREWLYALSATDFVSYDGEKQEFSCAKFEKPYAW